LLRRDSGSVFPYLYDQPLPAFAPPALQDQTPTFGCHAFSKAMGPFSTNIARLKRSFHEFAPALNRFLQRCFPLSYAAGMVGATAEPFKYAFSLKLYYTLSFLA